MTWRSEWPPVQVGGTSLHEQALAGGGTLIDGPSGAAVDAPALRERVSAVAGTLRARGFRPGDVLALVAPNTPPWAGVALGAMAAGGTVTPVNPGYTEAEMAAQIRDAGASIGVTVAGLEDRVRAAGAADVLTIGPELLGGPSADPLAAADDDVALLPYSSGTTGLPKGVMLTHRNLVTAVRQCNACLRLGPGDTVLAVAPFFHVMGFVLTLAVPLAHGATVVTMPRFEPREFLELIARHRVSVLVAPPPLMPLLAAAGSDLSSVRLIACGGAPLGPDVQRAVQRRLPGAVVGQGWGMTETSVGIAVPDFATGARPGTVGRLMPNTELRVADPDGGGDLPAGEDGELWVRGPQVMAGYLGRPDATAEVLDPEGWLRTGDLGHVEDDGSVAIVDRLKELIKVDAFQVAPAELEALLTGHPAVADAAVIGRPDARHGEVPVAFVVPRGDAPAEDDLLAWVAARTAPHKRLHEIRLCEAIPRTPSGKIVRRALREPAAAVPA